MFRRLVTGTLALLFTLGVIGGAPVLLIRVAGNPLPKTVPTLEQIWDVLLSPDNGSVFLKLLTLVGWLAWATFTISVLVEIPAQIRGRRAWRIPGMSMQQKVAGALVGSMLAIFVGTSVAHAAIAAPVRVAPVAVAPAVPSAYLNGQQIAAPQQLVYIVRRGDYLGRIAQRFTGDFDCYRDLANLNPNLIRNPNHIEPGWRIVLPANAIDRGIMSHATGTVVAPTPPSPPALPSVPPPPPSIAPSIPPSIPPSVPPSIPPSVAPSVAPSLPAAIAPSSSSPAPSPSSPGAQTQPNTAPVAQDPQRTDPAPASTETGEDEGKVAAPLAAGAGLAAASVLAAHVIIHRRQIRQTQITRRRRRRVTKVFMPTAEAAARQMAKHRAVDRLDAVLRTLAIGLRGRVGAEMPDIAAVWRAGGDIAVILTSPCSDPPEPFEERWQNTWSLGSSARLPESSWAPALLPGLLTFATWPQGGELLVDAERTGLLTLTGDPRGCENLLRSLAAEAATAQWTDGTSILLAGMDELDMRTIAALNPSRVRTSASVPEALTRITKRAAANATILQETETIDTMSARVGNVTEGFWATHVLFVADPWGEHSQQLRELDAQLAGLRRVGVAVVATHPTATRWSATVGDDSSLHMAWLAVAGANARQLTSEQLSAQLEVQA